jgi:hypothetical protein
MDALAKPFRKSLEDAVVKAREVAEAGAREALEYLGVAEAIVPKHLHEDQRALRRRLRAHGRALGDIKKSDGTQKLAHLVNEVAYEHWHTMLFARFLAETGLLMHPEGVAVSLEECKELAPEEGFASSWLLAGHYASRMLPQVFRQDSPGLTVSFAPNRQQQLEKLLNDLDPETFQASDSLGWVYQFWQAKKKDEVNKSEVKIGADELPAVTQLFTEDYMVSFLLDNSLGAWWAGRCLSENDLKNATSEQELREKASLPGVPLEYLRFVKTEEGIWTPAAGAFEQWPQTLAEFKTLDPCCGSGHFLVAALLMLVPMRMEEDGLTEREAVDRVLQENIHGLELDQRCVELAAFALAFTAWRYPNAGGYRPLPELHLACSGLAIGAKKEDWLALAGNDINLRSALEELYQLFKDAPVFGSLISPEATLRRGSLFELKWEEVEPLLSKALAGEDDDERAEIGVVAKGIAKAAALLSDQYQWIATNVPYKKAAELENKLREYLDARFPTGSGALETAFLERCIECCASNGVTSIVLPQNWLFLTTYRKFREKILDVLQFSSIARLGSGAFDTISGEVVKAILFTATKTSTDLNGGTDHFFAIDVSTEKSTEKKASGLLSFPPRFLSQSQLRGNPDARIVLDEVADGDLFSLYAGSYVGLQNGDTDRYVSNFWQHSITPTPYVSFQLPTTETKHFGGRDGVLYWENGEGVLASSPQARIQGREAWRQFGICIRLTKPCPITMYTGDLYDQSSAAIIPSNSADLPAIWVFCSSREFKEELEKIDQKRNVTNATFVKVTVQFDKWRKLALEKYPHGLPKPYSDDPTQWIFHGHPCGSVVWDEKAKLTANGPLRTDDTVMQIALARLLGYRWPAESDANMVLADEQRKWVAKSKDLDAYTDDDGIVCLPAIRGEVAAHERILKMLGASYGDGWKASVLDKLLESTDCKGNTLEYWLREKFFAQHCKLFNNRPFIWHIWDGLKDGFSALVNYHLLNRANLERLIYTYLGDWIRMQERGVGDNVSGAHERLAAAQGLKTRLEGILEGEASLDIFVRWKPLSQQPIGWDPDLNDGVRLNIRPFMSVDDVGKKGAGILRTKPNIHWKKDRGKDVESAPWYSTFKGERINDHHLTLAEKQSPSWN